MIVVEVESNTVRSGMADGCVAETLRRVDDGDAVRELFETRGHDGPTGLPPGSGDALKRARRELVHRGAPRKHVDPLWQLRHLTHEDDALSRRVEPLQHRTRRLPHAGRFVSGGNVGIGGPVVAREVGEDPPRHHDGLDCRMGGEVIEGLRGPAGTGV